MRTSEHLIELDIAPPHKGATIRLAAAVVDSVVSIWRILKNRRAINCLKELDDHQLNDIGLTRQELHGVLGTTALGDDPSRRLARSARARANRALRG